VIAPGPDPMINALGDAAANLTELIQREPLSGTLLSSAETDDSFVSCL
jgi:hypothetical protein